MAREYNLAARRSQLMVETFRFPERLIRYGDRRFHTWRIAVPPLSVRQRFLSTCPAFVDFSNFLRLR